MGKAKELSPPKRGNIELLVEEGYSQRAIANRLEISQSAVSNTLKRLTESGSYLSKKRSGRPDTSDQVVNELLLTGVSHQTVRGRLSLTKVLD